MFGPGGLIRHRRVGLLARRLQLEQLAQRGFRLPKEAYRLRPALISVRLPPALFGQQQAIHRLGIGRDELCRRRPSAALTGSSEATAAIAARSCRAQPAGVSEIGGGNVARSTSMTSPNTSLDRSDAQSACGSAGIACKVSIKLAYSLFI